jgi:hypothetical protein
MDPHVDHVVGVAVDVTQASERTPIDVWMTLSEIVW